jgi:hypothetical protein
MKCVACRSDAPTLTEAEIAELQPQVSGWEIVEQDGVKKLTRVFRFGDFAKALAFTNALGQLAEEEGHHRRCSPNGAGRQSHGGRTRSRACIETTSSWLRKPTSCTGG